MMFFVYLIFYFLFGLLLSSCVFFYFKNKVTTWHGHENRTALMVYTLLFWPLVIPTVIFMWTVHILSSGCSYLWKHYIDFLNKL